MFANSRLLIQQTRSNISVAFGVMFPSTWKNVSSIFTLHSTLFLVSTNSLDLGYLVTNCLCAMLWAIPFMLNNWFDPMIILISAASKLTKFAHPPSSIVPHKLLWQADVAIIINTQWIDHWSSVAVPLSAAHILLHDYRASLEHYPHTLSRKLFI